MKLRCKMSRALMLIIGGIGVIGVVQYLMIGLRCKKQGKTKKEISDELIEALKESTNGK